MRRNFKNLKKREPLLSLPSDLDADKDYFSLKRKKSKQEDGFLIVEDEATVDIDHQDEESAELETGGENEANDFSFDLDLGLPAISISSDNTPVPRIDSYNTSCNMVNADRRIFVPPTSGTNFSYPATAQDVLSSSALVTPRLGLPKLEAPPAVVAASNAMPPCILDSIPNTLFLPEPQKKAATAPAVSASKGGEPYFRKLESSRISFTDEFNSKY
jgi:hypothetical protein